MNDLQGFAGNRCNCACEFCLRQGKAEGSIYTEDSLWLEREPTRQEALDSFLSRDVPAYREIVFCGYGEPTYRLDDLLWLVDRLRERFGHSLPPVRIFLQFSISSGVLSLSTMVMTTLGT